MLGSNRMLILLSALALSVGCAQTPPSSPAILNEAVPAVSESATEVNDGGSSYEVQQRRDRIGRRGDRFGRRRDRIGWRGDRFGRRWRPDWWGRGTWRGRGYRPWWWGSRRHVINRYVFIGGYYYPYYDYGGYYYPDYDRPYYVYGGGYRPYYGQIPAVSQEMIPAGSARVITAPPEGQFEDA